MVGGIIFIVDYVFDVVGRVFLQVGIVGFFVVNIGFGLVLILQIVVGEFSGLVIEVISFVVVQGVYQFVWVKIVVVVLGIISIDIFLMVIGVVEIEDLLWGYFL